MLTFPSDDAFEQVAASIFYIETAWTTVAGDEQTSSATAFTVATLTKSRRLILATAGHVVEFPEGATVRWRLRQFDRTGQVSRECRLETSHPGNTFGWNKKFDIAWLALPPEGSDDAQFARPDEMPVRMIHRRSGVSAGTHVGWAGYPGQVARQLGHPQLCYFEGVVSAMVETPRPLYIVDGHAARGVSGGPVWHWSQERNQVEVVGVVSGYGHDEAITVPGFCIFEPINSLIGLFESWIESKKLRRQ